jgi:dihydroorotase
VLIASESSSSGQAIVSAVTSGSRQYFLGTDSAPHDKRMKECSCGCAGIYSAPVALSLYAKVFEQVISFCLSRCRSSVLVGWLPSYQQLQL